MNNQIYIPLCSNSIDQLRYEFSNIGLALYITTAQMMVKEHDYKLPLSSCNVGIIAEKLRITEDKLLEILTSIVEETKIYDSESFENGVLYCPELKININE